MYNALVPFPFFSSVSIIVFGFSLSKFCYYFKKIKNNENNKCPMHSAILGGVVYSGFS